MTTCLDLDALKIVAMGGAREGVRVDDKIRSLSIELEDTHPVSIEGAFAPVTVDKNQCVIMTTAKSKNSSSKHLIRGFVEMMILTMSGYRDFNDFSVCVINCDDKPVQKVDFKMPKKNDCEAWLSAIVEDLILKDHEYYLPIEGVDDCLKRQGHVEEVLSDLVSNDFKTTSSDFGPVTNLENYLNVDNNKFQSIYERRYRLFYESMLVEVKK